MLWSRREGQGSECVVCGLSDEPVIMENSLERLQVRLYGRLLLRLLQTALPSGQPAHSLSPRLHTLQVISSHGFPVSLPLPPPALSSLILGFIFIGNMAEFLVSGLDGPPWGPPRGQN